MFPVTWCDCCNLKPIALTFEPSKERWLFEKCEEMNLGNTFSLFSGSVVLIQKTYQIMLPLCQFVFKYQSILPYDCKIQYSIQRNITVHYCQQLKNLTGSCCSSLTGPGAGDESSRWRDGTINAFSQAMFAFPLFKLAFQHLYPWIGSTRSNKGWEGMVKKKKKIVVFRRHSPGARNPLQSGCLDILTVAFLLNLLGKECFKAHRKQKPF